jgi:hypothetical protein
MYPNCLLTAWQLLTDYLEWYKELFAGVDPDKTTTGATASPSPAPGALPALPNKKDGSVSTS